MALPIEDYMEAFDTLDFDLWGHIGSGYDDQLAQMMQRAITNGRPLTDEQIRMRMDLPTPENEDEIKT